MSQKAVSDELYLLKNNTKMSMNRIEQDLGASIVVERDRITAIYGEYLAHVNEANANFVTEARVLELIQANMPTNGDEVSY
jgi:hypothetical protein